MPKSRLQGTILRSVHHYPDPDDLFQAVRKEHSDASNKDIILAALTIMIEAAGSNDGIARCLHRLAMDHRGEE